MISYLKKSIEEDVRLQKKRRKKIFLLIVFASVLIAVVASVVIIYLYNNRRFTNYEVRNEVKRSDSNTVKYAAFGDNILKYSRDGASGLNLKGQQLWNGGYGMEQPQADVCEDFAVISDMGGKELYVYNGSDSGTRIETALPIVKARVAAQGVVAVLERDKTSNIITIYNPYSNATPVLVEIPTNVDSDGYPVDFDISSDGNSLVVSYLKVNKSVVSNRVNFYNFTEVGQDKNRLVGTKDYGKETVFHIEFLDGDKVGIFREEGFSVYSNLKEPQEDFTEKYKQKIKSVVTSEDGVGVILMDGGNAKKHLKLYTLSGKEKLFYDLSYDYDQVYLKNDELVFYSGKKIRILRCNGKEKADITPQKTVQWMFSSGNSQRYYLIDEGTIQEISLSGG